MKKRRKEAILFLTVIFLFLRSFASDDPSFAVYQYSVIVGNRTAYCWIPPKAIQVRGVIIALSNLLERRWLEDPLVRKTAENEGLAIIWVGPQPMNDSSHSLIDADMDKQAGDALQKMLSDLSEESGYGELAFAPLIPMGHAQNGPFAWNVAGWNPARIIAVIPVKTFPLPISLKFQGVPVCYMMGETPQSSSYRPADIYTKPVYPYFSWQAVKESALLLRASNENNLVSVVTDPGGSYFDWSDKQAKFLSLFIRKACRYRLPARSPYYGPVILKRINKEDGWLTDAGGMEPDTIEPAAYSSYKGDPRKAYWFFDRETALAAAAFNGDRKKRSRQLIAFMEDGKPVPLATQGYASMKFRPDASLRFMVQAVFVPGAPAALVDSGILLKHPPGPIKFRVITGPAVQTGEATFRFRVDRGGANTPVWLQAEHQGDESFSRTVQPCQMNIPARLTTGKPQRISFSFRQTHHFNTKKLTLHASSDAGLPVSYYVVAGPAYMQGNELILTKIPVWSKFPVKITVVAYQWGSMHEPLYQTAEPAIALFYIQNRSERKPHPVREQIIIDLILNYLLHGR